jgi:glycosyltransferase involved in cell wall biosynthesis
LLLDAAETLRDHPQIRFVIIGDGSEYTRLVAAAGARRLRNVVFKGRQPAAKMPQYFAAADALLVQLKMNPVFAVTIPTKVQSYLACGRPILAALDGAGAQLIRDAGAGVVCRPDDPQALREAVLTLCRMTRREREKMGENARSYYERHFDRRFILARLDAILAAL